MVLEDLDQILIIEKMSFSLPWPASAYHYELNENPNSLLWVAEKTNLDGHKQIAGMIVIWLILDEAHIATLAVHPDNRRTGIARCLLKVALKEILHRRITRATLEVRSTNSAAISLYYQFGFEIAGHRPRYYRDNNEDALLMTVYKLDTQLLEQLGNDLCRETPGVNQWIL